ncbi:MAG: EAL domain-containing protein [Alphaproteobacteria bacterium]
MADARMETGASAISVDRIEHGMRSGEMVAHFQPVVDAETHQPLKVEALARWTSVLDGFMPPSAFIPVMERHPETMERFTLWMIGEAFRLIKSANNGRHSLVHSVNVSRVNLSDLNFPDRVGEIAHKHGTAPEGLTLEITESAATSDPTSTMDVLTRLRIKGFGLSLDDFGTGYSSLVSLHRMPFSEIKIDRSFVSELPDSREAATIIKTVVDLARNMGLVSVAEGVETEEQAIHLRELGVRLLQGYHFGRPMPAPELAEWLHAR